MRSPRMSRVSNMIVNLRNNKMSHFYHNEPTSNISALRIGMMCSLIATAAIVATINYITLAGNEHNFALSQYKSIAVQALDVMLGSFNRMQKGTLIVAKDFRYAFPNMTDWPNVALPGFEDKGLDIAEVSSLDNLIFSPLFTADKAPALETFMKNYWASNPYYPDMSVYPGGAIGIWATNDSLIGTPGYIYHDTTGRITNYHSNYQGLMEASIQVTFSADIGPQVLGDNGHADATFGPPLDQILNCVNASSNLTYAQTTCAFFSNVVPLPVPSPVDPMPVTNNFQAFIFQPIIFEDPSTHSGLKIMGTVAGAVNWKTLLSQAVPSYVNGLDCVVTTTSTTFTYRMKNGVPVFGGVGDDHDHEYSDQAESIDLLRDSTISSFTSYKLTFYPRRTFFKTYQTDAPIYTTVGAIVIIMFCSCVFFMYDTAISRESTRKEVILDTKRRFVRFISHEIRTPLNTVNLGLKLLEMEMTTILKQSGHSQQVREAITSWIQLADDIRGNGDSAVDVLNDLLNYDKIESGTLRLEYSAVGIFALVKKTTSAFVMQAKQKSIDMQLIGEAYNEGLTPEEVEIYDNLKVVGDATRIAQVLRNLLSNALKFTPEKGSVAVRVSWEVTGLPSADIHVPDEHSNLLAQPRSGSIRISVTDSGAGLSSAQLAQICTEGTQFNANQLQAGGGSGLGLYISKGLAEQHGGNLMVSSDGLGRGSTFRLELPLFRHDLDITPYGSMREKKPKAATTAQPRRAGQYASSNRVVPVSGTDCDDVMSIVSMEEGAEEGDDEDHRLAMRPRRILVVDDAASNRKLLIRILEAKGYICNGAEDGQQAVDLYISLRRKGEIIDAILMDFEMPVMDGPTATKRIRELGCNCFIVGVTGNLLPRDIDHFRAHGATMVLAKPLNVDVFESTFRNFHAMPDMDCGEILQIKNSVSRNSNMNGEELDTAKLHPLGAAANV